MLRVKIMLTIAASLSLAWPCKARTMSMQGASAKVSNTSHYVGDDRWSWTVFVVAPRSVLNQIQCVEYTLHPTFPNPIRRVCVRGKDSQAFALSSNGWGEFTIGVRIFYQDGTKQTLSYPLKLSE